MFMYLVSCTAEHRGYHLQFLSMPVPTLHAKKSCFFYLLCSQALLFPWLSAFDVQVLSNIYPLCFQPATAEAFLFPLESSCISLSCGLSCGSGMVCCGNSLRNLSFSFNGHLLPRALLHQGGFFCTQMHNCTIQQLWKNIFGGFYPTLTQTTSFWVVSLALNPSDMSLCLLYSCVHTLLNAQLVLNFMLYRHAIKGILIDLNYY